MDKNNSPLISIIVPVYNVEKYIERCIESILSQTYTNFELLLIDDGSTDQSGKICDKYAGKEDRIKVYHKKNNGATSARLFGISVAKGYWIHFVDSDDTITPDSLERLIDVSKTGNYDIIGGTVIWNNSEIFQYKTQGEMNSTEYIKALLSGDTNGGPVAKIIRRDLFCQAKLNIPKEITNNEDLLMLISIGLYVNKVFFSDKLAIYNYRSRPNSSSSKIMPISQWIKLFQQILSIIKTNTYIEQNLEIKKAYFELILSRLYRTCIANGVYVKKHEIGDLIEIAANNLNINKKQKFKIYIITHYNTQFIIHYFYRIIKPLRVLIRCFH